MSNLRKPIDIRRQPRLSLARTFQLTVNGIKYRFFRSTVTMAVITVAIAFLMNSAVEGLVRSAVSEDTVGRISEMQLAPRWASALASPGSDEEILAAIAADRQLVAESPAAEERTTAAAGVLILDYLNDLAYGHRRQLVHNQVGLGIFDFLATADGRERLDHGLAASKSLRFPLTSSELDGFLASWPTLREAVTREREARLAAIKRVGETLAGRAPMAGLAEADGAFGEAVRAAGFDLSPEAATTVARQAREIMDRRQIEITMSKIGLKKRVAARYDMVPTEISGPFLWEKLLNPTDAAAYVAICEEEGLPFTLDAARVTELAERQLERSQLLRADRLSAGVGGGILGLGERMSWLLLVSLMVCGVGIANAMLMTVTERFREIATLKCLGALDYFIMLMFVLEASMLGVVGGFLGAILGMIIGVGRMMALYGFQAFTAAPGGALALTVLVAMIVGLLLAVFAAIYPSLKAARLAPMEAMRIE